jgi:asparagine synthase (glutamine-hydrolysing)
MERIKALLQSPATDIAHVYPLLRQIQTEAQIGRLLPDGSGDTGGGTLEGLLQSRLERLSTFGDYSQVSIADYLGYTQHVLLKDADQMSMAVSLEIREPFFDHDLAEYVLGLPDTLKGTSYPKQLLVESLAPLVPDEVVHRKKQGFILPYDVWMRNELASFCEQRITALSDRGYFRKEALLGYWADFLKGNARIRWTDIWIFVVLENWLATHGVE